MNIKKFFKNIFGKENQEPLIETFKDIQGQFRFRVRAKNGKIIANSEAYLTKQSLMKGIKSLKITTKKAKVVEK